MRLPSMPAPAAEHYRDACQATWTSALRLVTMKRVKSLSNTTVTSLASSASKPIKAVQQVLSLKHFWHYFFLAVLLCISFVHLQANPQSSNVQATSRIAPAIGLVYRGELNINQYEKKTVDKALFEENYYTDKPIGFSALLLPSVSALRLSKPEQPKLKAIVRTASLATIPPLVLGGSLLLQSLSRVLYSDRFASACVFIAYGFASIVFIWSNALFAHCLSAFLVVLEVFILHKIIQGLSLKQHESPPSVTKADNRWRFLCFGLTAGFFASVEYQSVLLSGLLLILFAVVLSSKNFTTTVRWSALTQSLLCMACGAAIGAAPMLLYNHSVYGNPLHISYSNVVGFEGMKTGFFGIGFPSLQTLRALLFGEYRGLLVFNPVSLLSALGLCLFLIRPLKSQDASTRFIAWSACVTFLLYMYINASYFYWDGGFSTGPRHLIPAAGITSIFVGSTAQSICNLQNRQMRRLFQIVITTLLSLCVFYSACWLSIGAFSPDHVKTPIQSTLIPWLGASLDKPYTILLPICLAAAAAIYLATSGDKSHPNNA